MAAFLAPSVRYWLSIAVDSNHEFTAPGSLIDNLLQTAIPLPPCERARVLEDSGELETIYKSIALENPSAEDINSEDDVDHHYIAFVRGSNGDVFEMDGDTDKGPCLLGGGSESLATSTTVQEVLKRYLERGGVNELGFSLLGLVGEI
jgi:ubiquitin carboxyl-terminal hydrolase L3